MYRMAATYEAKFTIIFICILFIYSDCMKLNVPRVLLPFSQTVSVNFTLEVTDGGCYRWYVSRPEVIRLLILDDEEKGCSSKAVVTSTSKVPTQQTALVTIVNDATGDSLHCDVTITSIHKLEITTTTRELFLEDTPEAFTLVGKDTEDDTFSSIDGLVFDWSLITDVDVNYEIVNAEKVLRFMKFSESLYKASPTVYALEAQNLKGYTVLVQGIKTGTAKVRATLKDIAYPEPMSTEITLSVVANLILFPSYEVRLLVGGILTYEVRLLQYGKLQKIPMPSDQFYLEISDESVATINAQTSEVEALSTGYTTVVLKDRNIKTKQSFRQPSAGIHVVTAYHIGFAVYPHQNWHLIKDREYAIAIKLYDTDNNEILNTNNIRVSAAIPGEFFDVLASVDNGTHYHVKAKTVGSTQIRAKLDGLLKKNRRMSRIEPALEETQDLEILDRTYILPERVILPWNALAKPTYKVQLKAYGGGNYGYNWKSHNPSIATCNQLGEVVSRRNGTVNITAASVRNLNDFGLAKISILLPYSLAILNSALEIDIGNTIYLPVALYTYLEDEKRSQLAFTDCTQYPILVESGDSKKLEYVQDNIPSTVDGSCVMLPFKALAEGFVQVSVGIHGQEGEVRASTLIGIYKPLTLISRHKTDGEVVLAIGSSVQIAFEGGPRPWSLQPQTYFRNVGVDDETIASTWMDQDADISSRELHILTVLCKELGETVVVLNVGNLPSTNNQMPVNAQAKVRVICAVPTVIELHPLVARPEDSRFNCVEQRRVASQCYRDLEIQVLARDQKGRLFDNFSSMAISWKSSDTNLATITEDTTLLTLENFFDGYRTLNKSYQTLFTKGLEGFVKVVAKSESYHQESLLAQGIYADPFIRPPVTAMLYLDLVEDAYFTQNTHSIFNHPQNNVSLSVLKGSGQFYFEPIDESIASIHYDEKFHQFKVAPKSSGSFNLVLYDACLAARQRASASVRISGTHRVEVTAVDKVGLDKTIIATVHILDQDGSQLPDSVFGLLDVRPQVSSNIISIQPVFDNSVAPKLFQFSITGKILGNTHFSFVVGRKLDSGVIDSVKSSDPHPIQVFSPLRLYPHNITLIIGAVFQISSTGGPHPQVNIEYSIGDSRIASVSSAGVIDGLALGSSIIIGKAVGIDSETGDKIIYSQDQVKVYVIPLTGIRIRAPLTRIQDGSTVPVYAFGVNDHETPFAFGSAAPALLFKWSSSNKEVAVLQPVYQQCGIQMFEANHFMMRLAAKQQGQVTIFLTVSPIVPSVDGLFQIQDDAVLTAQVQIQVFEKLQLVVPPIQAMEIVITPNSDFKLISNKDQNSMVQYQILHSSCPSTQGNIRVTTNGLVKSGKALCFASLVVTATDEIGANQTLSTLITVAPIAYMIVTPACSFHTRRESLTVVPVGTLLLFHVNFYNNVGKEFHATNSRMKFFPSRYDLVQIMQGPRNGTFYVKANNPGLTVLRVWDAENVGIEDYILIETGEVIHPSRTTLTLGDRVCLSCPLVSADGRSGTWHSDSPSVLRVDGGEGVGFATSLGTATILYNVSASTITSTEVSISPVTSIKFQPTSFEKHLTNAHPGKAVHFPMVLHGGTSHATNLHGKNCTSATSSINSLPFRCILRFGHNTNALAEESIGTIFAVEQAFDFDSGYHECVVKAKPVSSDLQRKLSPLMSELELVAEIAERPKQEYVSSEVLHLPFYPAFHVHAGKVEVDDLQPSGTNLSVSANELVFASLKVVPNDTALIAVLPPVAEAGTKGVKLYPIKLSPDFWKRIDEMGSALAAEVILTCPLTNREARVPVKVKIHGDATGKCPANQERTGWRGLFAALAENYQNMLLVILSLIGTSIATFIGYHALMGQRYYAAAPKTGVYLNRTGEGRLYPGASPSFNASHSAERPHLWSVNEPVQGSPSFQRTPSPRVRTLFDM